MLSLPLLTVCEKVKLLAPPDAVAADDVLSMAIVPSVPS